MGVEACPPLAYRRHGRRAQGASGQDISMRNSAFPANSARIQTRTLSVRPPVAPVLPSLQPLNPSTLQHFSVFVPTDHGEFIPSLPAVAGVVEGRITGQLRLLLTSNSLPAITYATVHNCRFYGTLSLFPATLTRYPTPNSLPAITYKYRGGGGVRPRVCNLLKTNGGVSANARFSQSNGRIHTLAFHESPVTIHESPVTSHESRVRIHESRVTDHESRESS
jgi:hypothetical protein